MNGIEKLIELFRKCDTVCFTVTGCGEEWYKTIEFRKAIEALEKQIPKEPIYISKVWPDGQKHVEKYCPKCKEELFERQNFCDKCGQKIEWEPKQ